MKKIKLLFNNPTEKLKLIKLIKEVFSLNLKEAKDFVDSGEMIPKCFCDDKIISFLRLHKNLGLEVIILDDPAIEKVQKVVEQYTGFVLLKKEEHEKLLKYRALYHDLIGSIETLVKDFHNVQDMASSPLV